MVDCGSPRCAQERRSIKRELLSWAKKIPVAIALERIAKDLSGVEEAEELIDPFYCIEQQQVKDFEPADKCFYCNSRLRCIFDVVDQLAEESKHGKPDPENPNLRYLQDLLPYLPQYYTQALGHSALNGCKNPGVFAAKAVERREAGSPGQHVELRIPRISPGGEFDCLTTNGRRGYSDDELAAAMSDIRQGKLGTRRASALYGIPRSTLRNKLFKLENLAGVLAPEVEGSNSGAEEEEAHAQPSGASSLKLSDLLQASSMALPPLPFSLLHQHDVGTASDTTRKLEHLRHKHNLNGTQRPNPSGPHPSSALLRFPVLLDLIHILVQQRFLLECPSAWLKAHTECLEHSPLIPEAFCEALPPSLFFPPFSMASFMASTLPSAVSQQQQQPQQQQQQQPQHDLRIPSYHPSNGAKLGLLQDPSSPDFKMGGHVSDCIHRETLKDIIAKTISEKLKFRDHASDDNVTNQSSSSENSKCSAVGGSAKLKSDEDLDLASPPKRARRDGCQENQQSSSSSSPTKKTRPKRGQYRKYNSQLLMEAVRAVQRGEMSVHRAGSYFGVPHSTLEYKVKERHLLRQKKPREGQSGKPATSSSATSSTSTSPAAPAPPLKSPVKSEPAPSPLKALGMGVGESPGSLSWFQPFVSRAAPLEPSAMGFFQSSMSLSTPASELLRKLQHKVQSKAGNFGNQESSSFPDFPPSSSSTLRSERFLLFN